MTFKIAARILPGSLGRFVATTIGAAITALGVLAASQALAAEGAASHYLPGVAGDFGVALPPDPGLQVANVLWFQSGDVGATVLQGQVNVGLDVETVLDIVAATYTFDTTFLGGRYTVGLAIPFGYAKLDALATGHWAAPPVSARTASISATSH